MVDTSAKPTKRQRRIAGWTSFISVIASLVVVLTLTLGYCSSTQIPHDQKVFAAAQAQWRQRAETVIKVDAIFANTTDGYGDVTDHTVVTVTFPDWSEKIHRERQDNWSDTTQAGATRVIFVDRAGVVQVTSNNPGTPWDGKMINERIGNDRAGAIIYGLFIGIVLAIISGLSAYWVLFWLFLSWNRRKYERGPMFLRRICTLAVSRWRNRKRTPKPSPEVKAALRYEAELRTMVSTPKVQRALHKTEKLIADATDRDNLRADDIGMILAAIQRDVKLDQEAQLAAEEELATQGI